MSNSPSQSAPRSRDGIAIVVAQFNEIVSKRLLEATLETLRGAGWEEPKTPIYWVPGAFEIPTVAMAAAKSGQFSAIICLGAVIRGGTPHFDFICQEAARGIQEVGIQTGIPCLFGVLTCDTMEQAMERCGGSMGNKGNEAAQGALDMIATLKKINPS